MKIAYRTVGGSVLTWGDDIVLGADIAVTRNGGTFRLAYSDYAGLTQGDVALASTSAPIPDLFKADESHTWDGAAFVATDWTPPAPEVDQHRLTWEGCKPLPRGSFLGVCSAALGAHYIVLRSNPAFIPIWDVIQSSANVDPFDPDGIFKMLMTTMKTTNLVGVVPETKMISNAQESAIVAAWKVRQSKS